MLFSIIAVLFLFCRLLFLIHDIFICGQVKSIKMADQGQKDWLYNTIWLADGLPVVVAKKQETNWGKTRRRMCVFVETKYSFKQGQRINYKSNSTGAWANNAYVCMRTCVQALRNEHWLVLISKWGAKPMSPLMAVSMFSKTIGSDTIYSKCSYARRAALSWWTFYTIPFSFGLFALVGCRVMP